MVFKSVLLVAMALILFQTQSCPSSQQKQVARTCCARSAAFQDGTPKNRRPLRSEVCALRGWRSTGILPVTRPRWPCYQRRAERRGRL